MPASRRSVLAALGGAAVAGTLAACSGAAPDAGAAPSTPGSTLPAPSPSSPPASSPSSTSPSRSAASGTTGTPTPTTSPAAGADITRGPAGVPAVALTFHGAGDPAIARRLLAELAAAGAHVTVLAVGQWLAAEPGLARAVLDAGHDLGNHTWSHQTMPRLAAPVVRTEIDRAAAELRRLTGSPGRWFRPSGTPSSTPSIRAAAVAAGYGACLAYDVDPMDYADPGPDAVVRRFTAAVGPGSIVSLHFGHAGTVQAMPRLLDVLRSKGLRAVTATELLAAS